MEDFEIEILRDEHSSSRYLIGYIRNIKIDFEKIENINFLIMKNNEIIEKNLPYETKIVTNNDYQNVSSYFIVPEIYAILNQFEALDNEFFIEIDINNKPVKSINSIHYK